ncbi:hypothetical protein RCZ04_20790 [Capnocytophaga sp. HP1101]
MNEHIKHSRSYRTIKTVKTVFDDYYLDPLIGLIPVVGDGVTQLFNLSFFYLSIFKIKSYALTVAILRNILLDILIGIIPYLGIVLDFFHKSYNQNYNLIKAFVDNDTYIINKVKRQALPTTILIIVIMALIGVVIYYLVSFLISLFSSIYHWVVALF